MAASGFAHRFTVFTPSYNRAHTLPRVFASLRAQTVRDFEWLVVDDGSTDSTRELVGQLAREADFPVRYVHQENQGKHVALNRGIEEARGALFLALDSDDACVPHALERFQHHWEAIPAEARDRFSAVTALCMDQHGRIIGDPYPFDVTDSDSLEIRYRFRVRGEKWGFQRTDVVRRFPFPVPDQRTYVPEGLVWGRIARHYRTRFVNEPLRIYHVDEPGRADQLTRARVPARDAAGYSLWHRAILEEEIDWFWWAPSEFLRSAVHYVRFSLHSGDGLGRQRASLRNRMARLLWVAAVPVGVAAYLIDRRAYRSIEP